ncbi:uncharacterized protein LOC142323264 [Lycorma delicatula]|uniref:uncharacterized protein LOC142323264 n=1 Tax=Lycorma delicatula TaxID=130591 RepID=UPI003F51A5B8
MPSAVQHSTSTQKAGSQHSDFVAVTEKILKECSLLYSNKDNGLVKIAEQLGVKLSAPRKKVVILLIGNHSAGKSSFINWYINENVQKTGVAIETQGFVLVTSGKRRESLTGNATLHLYPHFHTLEKINGVVDFLSTEISTSKEKKFNFITFVDTPGLVDGDMQYPFDVNEAVHWLGGVADLIFVFFDPIGQALCKRTLSIVERLNIEYADKLHFYLTKADDAGNEADRQKVMMQIVQELCKRPGLNRTAFSMPAIFIPNIGKETSCMNQIDLVCDEIEKAININIQNTMNKLDRDCELLLEEAKSKLELNNENDAYNSANFAKAMCVGVLAGGTLLWFMSAISPVTRNDQYSTFLQSKKNDQQEVAKEYVFTVVFTGAVVQAVMWTLGYKPTLSRKEKKQIIAAQEYIKKTVKSKKELLYRDYLDLSVGNDDL